MFVVESRSDVVAEASGTSEQNPEIAKSTRPSIVEKLPKVSKKFTEILFKAIEDNNQEGYDYLEFKQALQNLKALDMDEVTRYKSAFASAQALGVTPDGLISSAQYYQEVLITEEQKFGETLKNQRFNKIETRHADIEKVQQTISHKRQEIEQLQLQIQKLEEQLKETKAEVSEAEVKFQQTQEQFDASYHNLIQQIKADVDKIKQYLT